MLRNKTLIYLPALLITIAIAVASLWENPLLPKAVAQRDLLVHGILYVVLAASWAVPVSRDFPARVRSYIYVCVGSIAYGGLMEILQRCCTLTRTASMADLYADIVGAVIGVSIIGLFEISKSRYLDKK